MWPSCVCDSASGLIWPSCVCSLPPSQRPRRRRRSQLKSPRRPRSRPRRRNNGRPCTAQSYDTQYHFTTPHTPPSEGELGSRDRAASRQTLGPPTGLTVSPGRSGAPVISCNVYSLLDDRDTARAQWESIPVTAVLETSGDRGAQGLRERAHLAGRRSVLQWYGSFSFASRGGAGCLIAPSACVKPAVGEMARGAAGQLRATE